MKQRIGGIVFALLVGGALAWLAYDRVTDPQPGVQRALEEGIVLKARAALQELISPDAELDVSDPLQRNRIAGKVYIYPVDGGWEVSGHYRRSEADSWHPWLMVLDGSGELKSLVVRDSDPAVIARATSDPRLSVDP